MASHGVQKYFFTRIEKLHKEKTITADNKSLINKWLMHLRNYCEVRKMYSKMDRHFPFTIFHII